MTDARRALVCLAAWACCAAAAWAADPITFSADRVRSVFAAGREETVLTGAARVSTGDIEIRADEIRMYGNKQRFIESTGSVVVKDSKRNITLGGDRLYFDRDSEILKVSGNTVMEDFANDMLVRAGMLESRNKDETTIFQVGVRVFKKDIVAKAEMLVHRRTADTVELTGLPVVTKNGDEYRASTITIDLKTEEIQLLGRVRGAVKSGDEAPKADPAPAGAPEGAPESPAASPEISPTPAPSASPDSVPDADAAGGAP